MIATNASISIAAIADEAGVIPRSRSASWAWCRGDQCVEADTAPQAMVMNRKGKAARPDRAVAAANCVTAGIFIGGAMMTMPMASAAIAPIFRKVER